MNLKQLITIWTRDLLDWLTSKFDSITTDISDLAKEATLGDVESVLGYIEQGGMPQIAQIAKQGTNANANISEIQALIGYTITEIDGI